MKIALLSSFNADLLPTWLSRVLLERHINVSFYVSGFDQYRQEILDPTSGLYHAKPDVVILLLDSQDVLADLVQNPLDFTPEQRQDRVGYELSRLSIYSEMIQTRLPGTVLLLNTFVTPPRTSLGLLEYNSLYSVRDAIAQYNAGLVQVTQETIQTYIVDCEALAMESGWGKWTDERMWLLGRMRLSRDALEALAQSYSSAILAVHGTAKKVLALDADNTLWGGIIGTDGIEGIQLGQEGIGLAYRQFQAEILNLHKRGVVLALVSKNNPGDVYEVLDNHPAMLLQRKHLAAMYINWQDKVTNLQQLASQLNLGLDSIVFVDDDPFECAWVRDQLPETLVLQLPKDPTEFVLALRKLDAFTTLTVTSEDLVRGQHYQEERKRQELRQAAGSLEVFYRSLEMHGVIRPVNSTTLLRMAQLTQKTNQFNLTTRRYTDAEMDALVKQPDCLAYTLALSDRFGDNGIVGAAILFSEGEISRIDTFLLSCRVMGRTIETAFLAFLANRARASGARYLKGEFLPTRKNMPTRHFYKHHGFEPLATDDHWWCYDLLTGGPGTPDYITLDLPEEAK